ncbi:MAG: hypothetical protein WCC10_03175 [Tumebacillaceae bacterium]
MAMRILANYTPLSDIPPYVPCLLPALYDSLRHAGVPVYLSLFPILNMHGVPCYTHSAPDQQTGIRNHFVNYARTDALGYGELTDYLGFDAESREAESFEQGLELIRHNLSQDKPFVLFGAMYYLPYSKHYLSQDYLEKRLQSFHGAMTHWFSIYGLGEEEVLINDPTPQNYLGPLSLESLEKFWKGDRWIPELTGRLAFEEAYWTFGYCDVRIERRLTEEEVFQLSASSLKTAAFEYLAGREVDTTTDQEIGEIHFFGASAYQQLRADLERMLAEEANKQSLAPYDECMFNLRYPHFFMQNMLNDLAQLYGEPYANLARMHMPITTEIEKLGNMFRMNMNRKSQDITFASRTLDKLQAVAVQEREFYEQVLRLFADQPLLSSQEQMAAGR